MTRTELHRLIDELPDSAVDPIGSLLERAVADPMVAILDTAPWDDEPISAQEEADAAEGVAGYRRGKGVPLEHISTEPDPGD